MLDDRGYRLNIGIVLINAEKKLFWGKCSAYKDAWQFPQGGMHPYETLQEAMYRELNEEVGLMARDVEVLKMTRRWVYYRLPPRSSHRCNCKPCIGQRQRWFLLKLISDERSIRFNQTSAPEFTDWRWVDYWYPLQHVVHFKRAVYAKILREFEHMLFL